MDFIIQLSEWNPTFFSGALDLFRLQFSFNGYHVTNPTKLSTRWFTVMPKSLWKPPSISSWNGSPSHSAAVGREPNVALILQSLLKINYCNSISLLYSEQMPLNGGSQQVPAYHVLPQYLQKGTPYTPCCLKQCLHQLYYLLARESFGVTEW